MSKPNGNSGIVDIHGRQYQTVALRVQNFREKHGLELSLTTEIVHRDEECVVMRATIRKGGDVLATGHAEEYRNASTINRTSALENCETSAIGRALAALGLGGTEFATADELVNALQNKQPASTGGAMGVCRSDFDALPVDAQNELLDIAHRVSTLLKRGDPDGAYAELEARDFDGKENYKTALWSRFDSAERSALKKAATAHKAAA